MISIWPKLTTRFAGTVLQIGRLYIAKFEHWRLGFCHPKAVETKTGVCDIFALNLGKLMLVYERSRTPLALASCKSTAFQQRRS